MNTDIKMREIKRKKWRETLHDGWDWEESACVILWPMTYHLS